MTGMDFEGLPEGWKVWSSEERKVVLTYRPDVFDTDAFPAPCLPTIYITKGQRNRRPGRPTAPPEAPWFVTLFLEPDVEGERRRFDSKSAAERGAVELARTFASGDFDYRDVYQVPREDYFEELDSLTGD